MKNQQEVLVLPSEIGLGVARTQEEMRNMTDSGKQQFHDLTQLRIERNRAARHARCATMSK